jgi:hypothetical protein
MSYYDENRCLVKGYLVFLSIYNHANKFETRRGELVNFLRYNTYRISYSMHSDVLRNEVTKQGLEICQAHPILYGFHNTKILPHE